ncbi:hypothetical protein JCM12296A_35800 [Desulfosarcina cetonica]
MLAPVVGLVLLISTLALYYLFFLPSKDTPVQRLTLSDLKGLWTSTHPKYKDRFIQFDDQTLTFGRGPAGVGSYLIDGMVAKPADDGLLVHIRFLDLDANEYHLNFYYTGKSGGIIWMKHQQGVYWFHSNPEPSYAPDFK